MGKRSDFERVPRDFYPTPREAVLPLLPHLEEGVFVAEPCAGDGALARHLHIAGWRVAYAADITPMADGIEQVDALGSSIDRCVCDMIVTNPPWDRKILHPMITHFSDQLPTWLLFDADWIHTKQSAPFMSRLRKVVSVGRVKWIPDSKMTGKDNCAWYLFDKPSDEPTIFVGRSA